MSRLLSIFFIWIDTANYKNDCLMAAHMLQLTDFREAFDSTVLLLYMNWTNSINIVENK